MPAQKHRRKVPDETLIASYQEGLSVQRVAVKHETNATSVYKALLRANIPMKVRADYLKNARRYTDEQESQIIAAYNAGERDADLIRRFGGTDYSLKAVIRRAGLSLRPNPVPVATDVEIATVCELHADGVPASKIAIRLDRSANFVLRIIREQGLPRHARARGPEHGMWKGGRWLDDAGYVHVLAGDDAVGIAMRGQRNHVLEHRLVMARHLGRPLTNRETVHHIDGDPKNNVIENLQLRQGRHGKGACLRCRTCGSTDLEPVSIADPKPG
jgi:hypothetical protein